MTTLTLFRKFNSLCITNKEAVQGILMLKCRNASWHTNTIRNEALERHRVSPLNREQEKVDLDKPFKQFKKEDVQFVSEYREKFPEFLPNPDWKFRDRIAEKLEREDMHRRRKNIQIPEFYVGSIMAVTVADKYAPGKTSRFVGLCIHRSEHGLRHKFILRNVIDDQGIEIMYEMYNPLLQKIEVLVLEKRLDNELFYLRDCPLKYSYFPQDMEPQRIHEGIEVPVNDIQVELGPRPWSRRWERYDYKGIKEFTGWKSEYSKNKAMKAKEHPQVKKPWEKYDIMKHYRESVNPAESADIYKDVEQKRKDWAKVKKRLF